MELKVEKNVLMICNKYKIEVDMINIMQMINYKLGLNEKCGLELISNYLKITD